MMTDFISLRAIAAVFLAGLAALGGQDSAGGLPATLPGEDAEIKAIEKAYLDEAVKVRNEFSAQYLNALESLERELTGKGLLDDAVAVRNEIDRVKAFLEDPAAGEFVNLDEFRPALPALKFLPGDSERSRGVHLSPDATRLIGFLKPGASASWEIPLNAPEGTYEVLLSLSSARGEGGSFNVSIDDDQEVSQTIVGSGEWGENRTVYVGNVMLDGRAEEISVSVSGIAQRELFHLFSLELAPQGTWESRQGSEIVESSAPDSNLPPFKKLTGARYLVDPSNEGDCAYFIVNGKRARYRLYFVETPLDAEDKLVGGDKRILKAVGNAAGYFGVKPTRATEIGALANDFTRQLLAGQDVILYTRGEESKKDADPEGTQYAMIVTGGKILSEQLAQGGFGILKGKPTTLPDGTTAKTFYLRLKEKEKAAQAEGLGGWGA